MTSPDTEALVKAIHGFKPLELLDEIDVENIEQAATTIQSLTATIAEQAKEIEGLRKSNVILGEYWKAAESRVSALSAEVERLKETLRAVKQWTLFELRGNATRQPWRRRLDHIDASLNGGSDHG